jgi:hypothetical protein
MKNCVTIDEAIDDVFDQKGDERAESVQAFMARLHDSMRSATAALYRRTLLVLLLWLAGYLIATGVISEVEISAFHAGAEHLTSLLPAFPLAIGFVAYETMCAFKSREVTREALNRCYWHALPPVWSHDLEKLLNPHTYLDVEGMLHDAIEAAGPVQRSMAYLAPMLVGNIISVVPAIAIAHISYCGWEKLQTPGRILLAASIVMGALFWLRAMLLMSLKWQGPNRLRIKPPG